MLCCNPQDLRIINAAWAAGNAALIQPGVVHINTPSVAGFSLPGDAAAAMFMARVYGCAETANSNARQPVPVA